MHLVTEVPIALIPVIWPRVAELLQPSIDLSDGECAINFALDRLMKGENGLIVVTRGSLITMAYTVQVVTYETGLKELAVLLIGGAELNDMKTSFMPPIEEIAKRNNCTSIVMHGARLGWARKLKPYGWKPVREIIKYRIGKDYA